MKRFSMLGNTTKPEAGSELLKQARSAFRTASELKPNEVDSWAYLGLTYAVSQDLQVSEGIKALQRAIELSPSTPIIHYYLAQLYQRAGEAGRARMHYGIVLELEHNSELSKEARKRLKKLENN